MVIECHNFIPAFISPFINLEKLFYLPKQYFQWEQTKLTFKWMGPNGSEQLSEDI